MRGISIDLGLIRHRKGLSLRRLAELTELRPATLSELERGKTNGIDFDTLAKLCNALDCTPNDLLVLEEAPHIVPILGGEDEDAIIAERLQQIDNDAILLHPSDAMRAIIADDDDDFDVKVTAIETEEAASVAPLRAVAGRR